MEKNELFNFNTNGREHIMQEITSIAEQSFDLFDNSTLNLFESFTKEIESLRNKQRELQNKISNYREDNDGRPTIEDFELYDEIGALASDEYWISEHLNALSEMKIVYLYKSIEITMKSLIHIAYPKINTRDFFKWESMSSYFKSINVKISDFDGYNEVIELSKVNNSIKHNNLINDEIKKIIEFKNENQFTHINIGIFHKRIKPKIKNFLKLLGEAIIKDLYVFDDYRIDKICDDLKNRMDDSVLQKISNRLIDGNKPKQ